MGFWSKLLGRKDQPPQAPPEGHPVPRAGGAATPQPGAAPQPSGESSQPSEALPRLARLGKKDGSSEADALHLLRLHHGRPEQSAVLQAILRGLATAPGHETLRVACAGVLVDRGEPAEALELVRDCRSVDGMMLAAELHVSSGDLAHGISTIERVLARAIDTPGARERHERWCAQLGRPAGRQQAIVNDGATVVAPSGPETPFRLLREVARGGAGTIYEAEDELLGRRLAYKVYHRAEADHEQIVREARTAVELAGPGILRVFDADPNIGWLATEWLARGSLRDILRGQRFDEIVPLSRWAPQLLAALERVHLAGLVHADIKPGNVLFRAHDDPVLADFGICRRRGEQSLAGTPGYLAPERLAGGPADPRDDVYAIGRVVEDVLAALEEALAQGRCAVPPDAGEARHFERIAQACLADAATRPADATAVRALLAGTAG